MTSKEKKISFDGGNGGNATYLAGPDRNARRDLEKVAQDIGPMEWYVGRDPVPALELRSDGSVLVHGHRIGIDRRIYLGFRTFALPHEVRCPDFDKANPAKIDGVPLKKYATTRRIDKAARYIVVSGAGGLGDKSRGGRDGRDGRVIFGRPSPNSIDEILRFEGDGVVKTSVLSRLDADGWMEDVEGTGEIVRDGDRIMDLLRTFLREAGLLPEDA